MYQACCHMSLLSEGVRGHEVRIGRSCSGGGAVSRALSELAELIPAVICSVVTTSYVLRAEQAKAYGRGTDVRPPTPPQPAHGQNYVTQRDFFPGLIPLSPRWGPAGPVPAPRRFQRPTRPPPPVRARTPPADGPAGGAGLGGELGAGVQPVMVGASAALPGCAPGRGVRGMGGVGVLRRAGRRPRARRTRPRPHPLGPLRRRPVQRSRTRLAPASASACRCPRPSPSPQQREGRGGRTVPEPGQDGENAYEA